MESASSRATWAQQAAQVSRGPAASAGSRYLGRGGSLACCRTGAACGARAPACAAAGGRPRTRAQQERGRSVSRRRTSLASSTGVLSVCWLARTTHAPGVALRSSPPSCLHILRHVSGATRLLLDSTPVVGLRDPGRAQPAREQAHEPQHKRRGAALAAARPETQRTAERRPAHAWGGVLGPGQVGGARPNAPPLRAWPAGRV